ncbi:2,4-dichlorophenoxyacetate dioxygenase [Burkholderia sp. WAC0059]|uniref:TauD/TfdA dioxygenase family protein n=1 Tax=Burkholderia sp. WAC0059 TaxID=2066022 RepID=UPI000C7EA440|nr:TauD/TfdA family dioxygenase [Burkholderia sp. WAC0059]PLZ02871.1 2,4-dichlorophenoxyacetate dioxygenase [Burkholderia sp. WAC0059]
MAPQIRKLHPHFAAEMTGIDLKSTFDRETLDSLRAAMDAYGVLVVRDQVLDNDEQLAFAQRFDGVLHTKTSVAVLGKNRFGNEALTDISNVGANGEILPDADRRRMSTVSNRLWHTDASFENPPGRYSMLSARVVPPVRADTEFADMRTAYDTLDDETKAAVEGLRVHHSIAYSRQVLGFEFSEEEKARLKGAEQPLVQVNPRTGRRALYLASHAERIVGWPLPEGRLLLHDLMQHATRAQFVYQHAWREHDFVIWDNLATMHRARPFDDRKYRRELCRTTTLDLPLPA